MSPFKNKELEDRWNEVWSKTPNYDKTLVKRLITEMMRQSFVAGIMAGGNGNFYKWFDQRYKDSFDELFHDDDHFGI